MNKAQDLLPMEPHQELFLTNDTSGIRERPLKLGGILILVGIGLVLSLLQSVGRLLVTLRPFREDELWKSVTTVGLPAYHPYWKTVLVTFARNYCPNFSQPPG